MIDPRWRKVLRDIAGNKTRTLLVVLSIAIGTAAIGMVLGTQRVISSDLEMIYRETNPFSFSVYTSGFDERLVDAVRKIPEVKDVEGLSGLSLRYQVGSEADGTQQWKDIAVTIVDDFEEVRINRIFPEQGAWPAPKHTILVERASLGLTGKQTGDRLTVQNYAGKTFEVEIAGTVHELSQPGGSFINQAFAFADRETMRWLGYGDYYSRLNVVVAGDASDAAYVRSVVDLVEAKVEKSGVSLGYTYIPPAGQHWFQPYLTPMSALMLIIGALSLFISALLVINTISALLTQHIRQIGVMKAIGARGSQIAGMYLAAVLVYGLLALLVAIPLSWFAARGMVNFLTSFVNFDVENFRMAGGVIALQVVIALAVPAVAALIPIRSGVRITVREAINNYGLENGKFGKGRFDRLLGNVTFLSSPAAISLRNTFRRKSRLALTLITLILASAVFIAVATVYSSLLYTLDIALAYFNYDLSVNFSRSYRNEQIQAAVEEIPWVKGAESWGFAGTRMVREDGSASPSYTLVAPPLNTAMIKPVLIAGRWLLPEDDNAVVVNSDVLREDPDLEVGDEIVLDIEDRETNWTVVGIVRSQLTQPPLLFTNYDYFARLTGEVGRAYSIYLQTEPNDPRSQAVYSKEIETRLERAGLQVSGVSATSDLRTMIIQQFNMLIVFLLIMALVLALSGGLGLMATMSLNVLERRREIGVMRAIGASDGTVARIVVLEGLLTGLISFFFGTLLSLPLGRALSDMVGSSFLRAALSYKFSVEGTALWLVIILLIAGAASLMPARSASRVTVREVLAYE